MHEYCSSVTVVMLVGFQLEKVWAEEERKMIRPSPVVAAVSRSKGMSSRVSRTWLR